KIRLSQKIKFLRRTKTIFRFVSFYLASAQHFAIIVIYIYYGRPRIEKIVFHPRYSSSIRLVQHHQ
ncbi:unnamed protein product, partial [Tenebrio molitor]